MKRVVSMPVPEWLAVHLERGDLLHMWLIVFAREANLSNDKRKETRNKSVSKARVTAAPQTLFFEGSRNASVAPTRLSEPPTCTHSHTHTHTAQLEAQPQRSKWKKQKASRLPQVIINVEEIFNYFVMCHVCWFLAFVFACWEFPPNEMTTH